MRWSTPRGEKESDPNSGNASVTMELLTAEVPVRRVISGTAGHWSKVFL